VNKSGHGGTKCPFECGLYKGHVQYGPGQCPVSEKAQEVLWLSSLNPLLTKSDLDAVTRAVEKVVCGFLEKTAGRGGVLRGGGGRGVVVSCLHR
jgi:hypothetical protein